MNALAVLIHGVLLLWKVLTAVSLLDRWMRYRKSIKVSRTLALVEESLTYIRNRSRGSSCDAARWIREKQILPWLNDQLEDLIQSQEFLKGELARIEIESDLAHSHSRLYQELNAELAATISKIEELENLVQPFLEKTDDEIVLDFTSFLEAREQTLLQQLEELKKPNAGH